MIRLKAPFRAAAPATFPGTSQAHAMRKPITLLAAAGLLLGALAATPAPAAAQPRPAAPTAGLLTPVHWDGYRYGGGYYAPPPPPYWARPHYRPYGYAYGGYAPRPYYAPPPPPPFWYR